MYVSAAAVSTFLAPFNSSLVSIPPFERASSARWEALNSTGSVTSWKKVQSEKKIIPSIKRENISNISPSTKSGHERLAPSLVRGIMAVLERDRRIVFGILYGMAGLVGRDPYGRY